MNYQMGDFGGPIKGEELGAGLLDSIITPDVKASIVSAAKNGAIEGVKYVWEEYKVPIMLIGGALALVFISEAIANAKIISSKGNV